MQKIVLNKGIEELKKILLELGINKFLLVCDSSFEYLSIKEELEDCPVTFIKFNAFTSNPLYEDVCKGVQKFQSEFCEAIVAVGGGSAIDVAKCIKLYCRMKPEECYLTQEYKDTKIPLIAIPTTAGTGSESTRYAVIYYEGKKQSITHESIVPDYAILEPKVLKTLPLYQKKCTLLDALCQGIESWWSVNATEESKQYSKMAVEAIMQYKDAYINENVEEITKRNTKGVTEKGTERVAGKMVEAIAKRDVWEIEERNVEKIEEKIMLASNYAGRAINITQTTAAHAMSYKLTSLYGIPHGHAVAVCLPKIWKYMLQHTENCIDTRGEEYLIGIFNEIAAAMGQPDVNAAIHCFEGMLEDFKMPIPEYKEEDLKVLTASVNVTRLKNNPVYLSEKDLYMLYKEIMNK